MLLSSSCAKDGGVEHLISLDVVEQRFSSQRELSVRGRGFAVGVRCEAQLDGTFYANTGDAEQVRLRAPCRAISGEQALIELHGPAFDEMIEAPFEGRVEVRFGEPWSMQVLGRRDNVVLRLGSPPQTLSEQLRLRQRAARDQRRLGIAGLELDDRGVVITQLEAEGPAERAGARVGDLVVRFAGAPVQMPGDVHARAGAPEPLQLIVRREGELTMRTLTLQSHESGEAMPLVAAMCALLGVMIGALLGYALRSDGLWAPHKREFWLVAASLSSVVVLSIWLLQSLEPAVRVALSNLEVGAMVGVCTVYLVRRIRPTLRTKRDSSLAPLL